MTHATRITTSGLICGLIVLAGAGGCSSTPNSSSAANTATVTPAAATQNAGGATMKLGNFSVSLTVKDIAVSREFYEKLGFHSVGGNQAKNWLVMQNESATIGLFQGMFEKNMLTFNPGWDSSKRTLPEFEDVREIQRALKREGVPLTMTADETTSRPASVMLVDPDGNPILIDQHVPSPAHTKK